MHTKHPVHISMRTQLFKYKSCISQSFFKVSVIGTLNYNISFEIKYTKCHPLFTFQHTTFIAYVKTYYLYQSFNKSQLVSQTTLSSAVRPQIIAHKNIWQLCDDLSSTTQPNQGPNITHRYKHTYCMLTNKSAFQCDNREAPKGHHSTPTHLQRLPINAAAWLQGCMCIWMAAMLHW